MELIEFNKMYSTLDFITEPVIAGIDEAGRGPVVGPMVYGLYVMKVDETCLFKDSKVLTPLVRERALASMGRRYAYIAVSPVYIGTHMLNNTKNLNEIARETVVRLLKELTDKCSNIQGIFIDGLGNNEKYKEELGKHFKHRFTIENKADSKYPVVGGASIVAKVTRDRLLKEETGECGSGYPSDPVTQKWLRKNCDPIWGLPRSVRHSWAPIQNILGVRESKPLPGALSGFYTSFI